MVNVKQFALALLPALQPRPDQRPVAPRPAKNIAIVGGGTAGIAVLKHILEIPPSEREGWNVVLFEQRRDVGGVWLPDLDSPHPPKLPETPLYPLLRTNTPVPSMTYPGVPYPPGTPLYPRHTHIASYLQNVTRRFGLDPYVRLNHEVIRAAWVGNATRGSWETTVRDRASGDVIVRHFDHLVNTAGNYHYPRLPNWPGQELWLAASKTKRVVHSIFYREPSEFSGENVVIVGSGASGRDTAIQVSDTASQVYLSIRDNATFVFLEGIPDSVKKVRGISHFTQDGVVFLGNDTVVPVDTVLLGTGYHYLFPYLTAGGALDVDPTAGSSTSKVRLTTNLRYIFPLYEHTLSLDPAYPLGSLSFIGLPQGIANAPSDNALAIFIDSVFRNSSGLPSREELLQRNRAREEGLRKGGWDPYVVGHRLVDRSQFEYQDRVVDFAKSLLGTQDDGSKYVESWRREISTLDYLRRGWLHVEEIGQQDEWLEGVETEEQWVGLMRRLNEWQESWEKEHNVPFVHDFEAYL